MGFPVRHFSDTEFRIVIGRCFNIAGRPLDVCINARKSSVVMDGSKQDYRSFEHQQQQQRFSDLACWERGRRNRRNWSQNGACNGELRFRWCWKLRVARLGVSAVPCNESRMNFNAIVMVLALFVWLLVVIVSPWTRHSKYTGMML